MEILIGFTAGLSLFFAYLLGRKHEVDRSKGKQVELNPVKAVQKHIEKKEAVSEINKVESDLKVMLAYDGPKKQFDAEGKRIDG